MAKRQVRVTVSPAYEADTFDLMYSATFEVESSGVDEEDVKTALGKVAENIHLGAYWWTGSKEDTRPETDS